ncbi:MAG: hypothetical protein OXI17_15530 [Gammaproteobacteria bacterium]|nr:hypothetical protein [Gammaproteobacteria bacterium]
MNDISTAPSETTTDFSKLNETALDDMAVSRWNAIQGHMRKTVDAAWQLGHILIEKKGRLGHGYFLPWLERNHIPQRSAHRCMTLATGYPQISHLANFDSQAEALAALQSPEPKSQSGHLTTLDTADDLGDPDVQKAFERAEAERSNPVDGIVKRVDARAKMRAKQTKVGELLEQNAMLREHNEYAAESETRADEVWGAIQECELDDQVKVLLRQNSELKAELDKARQKIAEHKAKRREAEALAVQARTRFNELEEEFYRAQREGF